MPIPIIRLNTDILDKLIAQNPTRAKAVIRASSFRVEGDYKERVPRDPQRPSKDLSRPVTGNLRNSINTTFEKGGFLGIVQDGVEYGVYQELGTSRIPARPSLKPAVEKMAQKWVDEWRRLFDV